jgi:arabinose-5-phosphate isomerase
MDQPPFDAARAAALARDTLAIEADAVRALAARIDERFEAALRLVLACRGRVVVMGMGKSGHIGRKLAATLASTGTPSLFVHPAEASHGDLGMITPGDVVLALSNSGESEELTAVLPFIKRLGVPLLAFTGRADSSLARHADVVLDTSVAREACPHNLAPTASTTAQLALGDALAVALLDARGFAADDFARSHPGGSLGRRLLTRVVDVMRQGDALPRARPDTPLMELMRETSAKGLGLCAVVGDDGRVLGVFTDGDLRRLIERDDGGAPLASRRAGDVMRPGARTIGPGALAAEAAALMETHRINGLLVTDEGGVLVGALTTNDLLRAKVI